MKIAIPLAAVLLLLVIYEYGYVGISSELAEIRARQAVKMQVLRRSVALIEQKPELENQLAALREQVKSRSGNLIAGESISIANANLQGTVKGVVTERGGSISSERIAAPDDLEKNTDVAAKDIPPKDPIAARQKPATAPAPKTAKQPESRKLKVLTVSIDSALPDTIALSEMLYSLETRTPYMVVRELDVRVKNFNQPRDLMLRLDVSGLYGGK